MTDNDEEVVAIAIIQPDLEKEKYKFVGRIWLKTLEIEYLGERPKVENILQSVKTRIEKGLHSTATDTGGMDGSETYSVEDYFGS